MIPPVDPREEFRELVSSLKENLGRSDGRSLGYWKGRSAPAGRRTIFEPPYAAQLSTSVPTAKNPNSVASGTPADHVLPPGGTTSSPAENLRLLREEIGDCQRCPLGATRIKLAYGVGNPEARVMLIGEGPGYMEDRLGEPFVGPAGQLLDRILAAIELSRSPVSPSWKWVYIANIVKCHPMVDPAQPDKRGNDRPPAPPEIETCFPFLAKQIRIIRPRFIVTLGATAARVMLNTSRGITALRGKWSDFQLKEDESPSIRLLPTYHPAALLRNPELKKDVWEDIKKLRAELLNVVPES